MSDSLFKLLILLGIAGTVAAEWKPLRSVPVAERWLYGAFTVLSLGMLALYWMGGDWPLPARTITKYITPYIEQFVKGGQS